MPSVNGIAWHGMAIIKVIAPQANNNKIGRHTGHIYSSSNNNDNNDDDDDSNNNDDIGVIGSKYNNNNINSKIM